MLFNQSEPGMSKRLAITLVTLAVAAMFINMVRGFLIALFLAAVFSAMAYPLYRRITAAVGNRPVAAAGATLLLLILAVLLPGIALLILVADQAQDIAKQAIPWVKQYMQDATGARGLQIPDGVPFREQIQAWLPEIATKLGELSSKIGEFVVQTVSAATAGAAEFLLNLFVMLYAMFYFLSEGPALLNTLRRYATTLAGVQDRVFQQAVVVARATIKGTLVIGIVQGLLGGIGFAIFGVQGAAFWGTVMAIASMLPVVGTALIWIPAVIHLLAMGETTSAIGLAVWSVVIVTNVDNVLRPILVGGETQMPDLVVLISTFGGLSMFGGVGIILGPVIAAVCITLFQIAYETLDEPSSAEAAAQTLAASSERANKSIDAGTNGGLRSETMLQSEAANAEQTVKSGEPKIESSSVSTIQSREGGPGLLDVNLSEAQRTELQQLVEEVEKAKTGRHKAP